MEVHDFRDLGWITSHASEGGRESFMLVTSEHALFDSRNMTEECKELLDAITSNSADDIERVGPTVGGFSTTIKVRRRPCFRGWDIMAVERLNDPEMKVGSLRIHFERIRLNANLKTVEPHAPSAYDDVEGFGSW